VVTVTVVLLPKIIISIMVCCGLVAKNVGAGGAGPRSRFRIQPGFGAGPNGGKECSDAWAHTGARDQ
jgi:hypothetical protein